MAGAKIDRLADFMESVPVLSGFSDYFAADLSIKIGGEFEKSQQTVIGFGQNTTFATGYLPLLVRESRVDEIVDFFNNEEQFTALLDARRTENDANAYLSEHPQFDLFEKDSVIANVFSGDGLIFYRELTKDRRDVATRFSAIFSSLVEINRLAGRLKG